MELINNKTTQDIDQTACREVTVGHIKSLLDTSMS